MYKPLKSGAFMSIKKKNIKKILYMIILITIIAYISVTAGNSDIKEKDMI
jgi:hypothetical protein